jgi:hypothetical protein
VIFVALSIVGFFQEYMRIIFEGRKDELKNKV